MIESLMEAIREALPETSRWGRKTIREVCLSFDGDHWSVLAGGHPSVHIGEWGGDFNAWGNTAIDALNICLRHVKRGHS